jgi:drug/metabolite transporter (DMT)-like permease
MCSIKEASPICWLLSLFDFRLCRLLTDEFPLIIGLTAAELMTVLLYLWSLKLLFVSYAVAAKRTGILLSVLSGWLFFGEQIKDKILYVLLMMVGMMLIVLAPDIGYNKHLSHP